MLDNSLKDQIFALFCNQQDSDSEFIAKAAREVADKYDFDIEELPEMIFDNICLMIKQDHYDLEASQGMAYEDLPY